MGAGVSGWALARAVALLGQLGVVSGTALAVILARRLQLGDPGGDMRRALEQFPYAPMAQRALDTYYIAGGKAPDKPYKAVPVPTVPMNEDLVALTVLANFAEVFLAKEGHDGLVGVNHLEKLQIPTVASLYGGMLAGVDYVLMGAGVPRAIPGILDRLAAGEAVSHRLDVAGMPAGAETSIEFDPRAIFGKTGPLKRPKFLAIVSSATLATALARKSSGRVDGFIVEGATAGGHNAPPRGPAHLNERGEPIYGERDLPDLEQIRKLGLPFWLAGSYAEPKRLAEARALGATGVQVGTIFALCDESGMDPRLKRRIIEKVHSGEVDVLTDPLASPTGFPFKVLQLEDTVSDKATYEARRRVCDLGYLRSLYWKEDGGVGYRCPAEPIEQYVRKGGKAEETQGRKCICNGLVGTVGMGQVGAQPPEKPIITAGDDVRNLSRFLKPSQASYTAADVVRYLLSEAQVG